MSRRAVTALVVALGLFASSCGKKEPAAQQPAPAPNAPDPNAPAPEPVVPINPGKIVTVDLAPHGVRAVIDVPESWTVKKDANVVLSGGENLRLEIGTAFDRADARKVGYRTEKEKKFLADEPGGYFVVQGDERSFPIYTIRKDLLIGEEAYKAEVMLLGPQKRASADLLWAVARTLRQSDSQKQIETTRAAALAKLKELGALAASGAGGIDVTFDSTASDEALAQLVLIPDLGGVVISRGQKLTAAGMKHLAASRARTVDLNGMWVTDALLAGLNPALELRSLKLEDTSVTDVGLSALAGTPELTALVLIAPVAPHTDAAVKHITKARKLTTVFVAKSELTDAGLSELAALPDLQRLNLYGTRVTDAGLKHLANKPKLKYLNLSRTAIRGPGLSHLEASTAMEALALAQTDVADEGLAAISGLSVRSVSLVGANIGDAGVAHVARVRGLTELSLAYTRVTDESVKALVVAPTLTKLDLSYTAVTGATFDDLRACPKLSRLDLDGTRLTDAAVPRIVALPALATLALGDTAVTDAGLKALEKLPPDRELHLLKDYWQFSRAALDALKLVRPKVSTYEVPPADPGAKPVAPPPAPADLPPPDPAALFARLNVKPGTDDSAPGKPIVRLYLSGDKLTDRDLADVRDLKALKELTVSGNLITDVGLAHLAKLTALESLSLSCANITDAGLGHLAGLTALRELSIWGGKVTGDGFVHLKELKNLKALRLPSSIYLGRHLAPLAELQALETIDLGDKHSRNSPQAAQLYARLPKLREIDVGTPTERFLVAIRPLSALGGLRVEMDGYFRPLTPYGASGIGGMKALRYLHISREIGDPALAELVPLAGLNSLTLGAAEFVTDAGPVHLARLTALTSLVLRDSRVTDAGVARLAALKELNELGLSGSRVTDGVTDALARLPALRQLHLDHTGVTDACVPGLAKLKALRSVSLQQTRVTREGVQKLKDLRPDVEVLYPMDDAK